METLGKKLWWQKYKKPHTQAEGMEATEEWRGAKNLRFMFYTTKTNDLF